MRLLILMVVVAMVGASSDERIPDDWLEPEYDLTRYKRQAGEGGAGAGGEAAGGGGGGFTGWLQNAASWIGNGVNKVSEWFKNLDTSGIEKGLDLGVKIKNLFMSRKTAEKAAREYEDNRFFKLTELCAKICASEWQPWTGCSTQCGGGVSQRTRTIGLPGKCRELGNFQCPASAMEKKSCNDGCANGGMPKAGGGCTCSRAFTGFCCSNDVTCPYPGKPRNGKIEAEPGFPAKYGTVVTYSCDSGYAVVGGTEQLVCDVDKGEPVWAGGNAPSCELVKCDAPPAPPNGRILNDKTDFIHGDHIIFMCNEGFKMWGPDKRQCIQFRGSKGRWTGFTPICSPKSCEEPDIPLYGERTGTNFKAGGVVTYKCATGFRLVGSRTRTCLLSGKWSGNAPQCKVTSCEDPEEPPNAIIRGKRETYTFGRIVLYECEHGYRLEGPRALKCVHDPVYGMLNTGGMWNDTAPQCKPASCGSPGTPEYGSKDGSVYVYPHNITFRCYAGYVMKGASEITCGQDTKWSNPIPTCEACPKNFFKASSKSDQGCTPCPDNAVTVTEGSTSLQQCICAHGYKGPPGGPCEEIRCPVLSAPAKGKMAACGNKLGNSCDVNCDAGYILQRGSSRRTCQSDGSWTGVEPFCGACPKNTFKLDQRSCLPCPRHSSTKGTGSSRKDCTCNAGYHGAPGGPCRDVNECAANGGRGPCQDTCENQPGSYKCGCSIPGYIIDENDPHTCIVNKTCRNLTRDDAPENGGLVCHWYREENSQQCSVRCNPGYEFPSRTNNFEYCGQNTGYKWTHEERGEVIEPCIEEFFPDFRLEGNTTYFVRACHLLTEKEKDDVKREFAKTLSDEGVCVRRKTKVCDMQNVGIICGRHARRKKRGVWVNGQEIHFGFDIKALRMNNNTHDCGKICTFLRIPDRHCSRLCFSAYRRFLRAAVIYSKYQLTNIFHNADKASFQSANRRFEAQEDSLKTTDVLVNCDPGMRIDGEKCVPCQAGTFLAPNKKKCLPCPPGMYQPSAQKTTCIPCPVGSTSTSRSSSCQVCPDGRYGLRCRYACQCVNGKCDPNTGACNCTSGWEGKYCEKDINDCTADSCFRGVACRDIPAPGTGYRCGRCPEGFRGNGAVCTRLPWDYRE